MGQWWRGSGRAICHEDRDQDQGQVDIDGYWSLAGLIFILRPGRAFHRPMMWTTATDGYRGAILKNKGEVCQMTSPRASVAVNSRSGIGPGRAGIG